MIEMSLTLDVALHEDYVPVLTSGAQNQCKTDYFISLPHIVIPDQGTDVVVDFVSHKAEHEVLSLY